VKKSLDEEQLHAQEDLHRGLKDRHVQMIAIGGTIGVGLFLGSAMAIQKAGPGLVVSYAIGGLVMFFIMRALGELLLYRPVAGSFATYAEEFVGPWAGFITGWSYWFMWVVIGMAEITAVGVYVHYWFPEIPQWVPALITLGLLYSANLITVKLFGEIEFWFALIKVVTIVAMIVLGLTVARASASIGPPPSPQSKSIQSPACTPFRVITQEPFLRGGSPLILARRQSSPSRRPWGKCSGIHSSARCLRRAAISSRS
jgi:L-asparagine transporter-like permease